MDKLIRFHWAVLKEMVLLIRCCMCLQIATVRRYSWKAIISERLPVLVAKANLLPKTDWEYLVLITYFFRGKKKKKKQPNKKIMLLQRLEPRFLLTPVTFVLESCFAFCSMPCPLNGETITIQPSLHLIIWALVQSMQLAPWPKMRALYPGLSLVF